MVKHMKQKIYNKLDRETKKVLWEKYIKKASPKRWKMMFDGLSRCQMQHDVWFHGGSADFWLEEGEAIYIKKYYKNYMKRWIKPFIENIIKNGRK